MILSIVNVGHLTIIKLSIRHIQRTVLNCVLFIIQRQPLEHTVLRIKEMDEDLQPHVLLGTALDPPTDEMVDRAILTLKQLGALTLSSRTSRSHSRV